ncbi:Fibrobacter succinogenes major domain (Fib_succ_major) [Candidatus Venteria ishoeyi]|uniref:Fibrobacter succinogenes major domain (Fib_succ_major) n=2 Tax=Candidatus Venteria ishoeyi TaxID=1899563 RepID=A0A1H6F8S3_9GAMM|nr:Fibrobacter succinogenes major domain (Fib_succ_major) [Candidatus Venteria ishoeyi]
MKVTHYVNGTAIPIITNNTTWANLGDNNTSKAMTYYNNNSNSDYGALYTWATVMNGTSSSNSTPSGVQGVCSTGWHVPSDNEWKALEIYLGMTPSEADQTGWRGGLLGGKLKETGYSHWMSPNTMATNTSDFTALPGGYRNGLNGFFASQTVNGFWWTATQGSVTYGYYRTLKHNGAAIARDNYKKSQGYSVRCVMD